MLHSTKPGGVEWWGRTQGVGERRGTGKIWRMNGEG